MRATRALASVALIAAVGCDSDLSRPSPYNQVEVSVTAGSDPVPDAHLILYTGARQRMPAVPKDAVLMEAGRPYVFVQTGGESFSRRYIEVASRDGLT